MTEIVQLISNVGFPIACCCVMFKLFSDMSKTLTNICDRLDAL